MGVYIGPDPYVRCAHCGNSETRNQSPRWPLRNWWQLQSMGDTPTTYVFCSPECLAVWLEGHELPTEAESGRAVAPRRFGLKGLIGYPPGEYITRCG